MGSKGKDYTPEEAAKHILTLAKMVAKSNQDKKEAEAIWKKSGGK